MQNSLVEMYALDENLTYQQAFVYIRQLAIHLRNAITNKKKVSITKKYQKYWNYFSKMLKKCYLGGFFVRPYCTNGIKTRLGSPVHAPFSKKETFGTSFLGKWNRSINNWSKISLQLSKLNIESVYVMLIFCFCSRLILESRKHVIFRRTSEGVDEIYGRQKIKTNENLVLSNFV